MTRTSSLVAALCVLGGSSLSAQQIPIPFPLKTLEEAVVRDSNDTSTQYYVALAYWNQQRHDDVERTPRLPEAIADRQNAVNADPDLPSLLIDLGVTPGKAGEYEVAIDALSRAAEANPRLVDAPFWTGMLRFLAIAPARSQAKIQLARQRLEELQ